MILGAPILVLFQRPFASSSIGWVSEIKSTPSGFRTLAAFPIILSLRIARIMTAMSKRIIWARC